MKVIIGLSLVLIVLIIIVLVEIYIKKKNKEEDLRMKAELEAWMHIQDRRFEREQEQFRKRHDELMRQIYGNDYDKNTK